MFRCRWTHVQKHLLGAPKNVLVLIDRCSVVIFDVNHSCRRHFRQMYCCPVIWFHTQVQSDASVIEHSIEWPTCFWIVAKPNSSNIYIPKIGMSLLQRSRVASNGTIYMYLTYIFDIYLWLYFWQVSLTVSSSKERLGTESLWCTKFFCINDQVQVPP